MKFSRIALLALTLSMPLFGDCPVKNAEARFEKGDFVLTLKGAEAGALYEHLDTAEVPQAGFEGHSNSLKERGGISCSKSITADFVVTPTSPPPAISHRCTLTINRKAEIVVP